MFCNPARLHLADSSFSVATYKYQQETSTQKITYFTPRLHLCGRERSPSSNVKTIRGFDAFSSVYVGCVFDFLQGMLSHLGGSRAFLRSRDRRDGYIFVFLSLSFMQLKSAIEVDRVCSVRDCTTDNSAGDSEPLL